MQDIEQKTRQFAMEKRSLDDLMNELTLEAESLKKRYTGKLRLAMNNVSRQHEDLYRMIRDNPALFDKPRLQLIDGIRVGIKAGKGTLQIEDEDITIKLIKKILPDQKDILIKTTEEPAKAAIKKLDEKSMKSINVSIVGKEDHVVIEEADTQLNKILSSLLKFQVEELQEEYSDAQD
jgi:hypothetical protein